MPPKVASQGYKALRRVEAYIRECGLLMSLIELVKMRACLLEEVARLGCDAGCVWLALDTALGNALAQRFYFRHGLLATGLHFGMSLDRANSAPAMTAFSSGCP